MFGRIILGLVIVVIGALVTIKSEWIYQNFGSIPSADKYLGTEGGSRLAYKLIGILISIIGFLMITGLHRAVLGGLVGLFTPSV